MNKEQAIEILDMACESDTLREAMDVLKHELEPKPIVVIIGSEYTGIDEFAQDLFDLYDIDALVVKDLAFAMSMVKHIDDVENKLLFIHLTLPLNRLADKIQEDYQIPHADALELANDVCFREQIINFDESTPDDLMVLTYTGESESVGLDKFVGICADIIKHVTIEEIYDGEEDGGFQSVLS